ncbi:SAM-dependent methyltransferase [Frankia gtarii]|uniref:SAM-dependent methyltransferase n=1 Tax=Frankia gtarii TaxID=2950102 RepID=UPI003F687A83
MSNTGLGAAEPEGSAVGAGHRSGPVDLRVDQPHVARMYDYYLGGKDNFPADREAAEQAIAAFPNAPLAARQNRAFLVRAARYLAAEVGIRQFLDVGTGIPTSPNLHEVVQGIAPDARVVYADNDPIVLTHARALLTSTPQGRTAYLDADLHDPASILDSAELRSTLDLTRPVALSLVAIFHFFPDDHDPHGIVRRLVDGLPSGSHVVITHSTADYDQGVARLVQTYLDRGIPAVARSRAEVESLFVGLEPVEPGVAPLHRWRPDADVPPELTDAQVSGYGGIARKP